MYIYMYIYVYIYIYICKYIRYLIYITIFLLLLIAPNIPPVSGNNNVAKIISSVKYFPQKSCRRELVYVLTRSFLFVFQQESRQTKASLKNVVYLWLLLSCKLGLHTEMLQGLAYIMKQLNITIKIKTGLFMSIHFLLYAYFYVL